MLGWIFFTASWWWRPRWVYGQLSPDFLRSRFLLSVNSADYQAVSYARFALSAFIVCLLFLWLLSGLKGLGSLAHSRRMIWMMGLVTICVWTRLSVSWATQNKTVASSSAMQWFLIGIFVLIILAVRPSPRWMIGALVCGIMVQAMLGIAQVALQHTVGIGKLDSEHLKLGIGLFEFNLDPAISGTSVIQSRGIRYLRAYGLTPHPNLLAGALVMGLMASLALWQARGWRKFMPGVAVLLFWALLISFSRASIVGGIIGIAITLILWWVAGHLKEKQWQIALSVGAIIVFCSIVFLGIYGDLVAARAGVGDEGLANSVEARSISDRRIYVEQAHDIISRHPWKGIGVGNFPWESHQMLQTDPRQIDLQGDSVHNFYYLMLSEIGVIGTIFVTLTVGGSGFTVLYRLRHKRLSKEAAALWGGVCAWLAIGWLEAYMWTLFTHQIILWGVLALIMLPPTSSDEETKVASDSIK